MIIKCSVCLIKYCICRWWVWGRTPITYG